MSAYQGRALRTRPATRKGPPRPWRFFVHALAALAVLAIAAHVPWKSLRRACLSVGDVRVEGNHYLDAASIVERSGIRQGEDLLGVDEARARQALLLDSRIAYAEVSRVLPHSVRIRVRERVPALLVAHGSPWEIDPWGVLLEPLERGVVADVPLLVGPHFDNLPAGSQVRSPAVERGLAWTRALADQALQLGGQVSELDVTEDDATGITLLDGTRVMAPAWPPSTRRLSALRVVLADLKQKGTPAEEVDVRFENQVIVRPVGSPQAGTRDG
jgi:cell division septal protein FtsQ